MKKITVKEKMKQYGFKWHKGYSNIMWIERLLFEWSLMKSELSRRNDFLSSKGL